MAWSDLLCDAYEFGVTTLVVGEKLIRSWLELKVYGLEEVRTNE